MADSPRRQGSLAVSVGPAALRRRFWLATLGSRRKKLSIIARGRGRDRVRLRLQLSKVYVYNFYGYFVLRVLWAHTPSVVGLSPCLLGWLGVSGTCLVKLTLRLGVLFRPGTGALSS